MKISKKTVLRKGSGPFLAALLIALVICPALTVGEKNQFNSTEALSKSIGRLLSNKAVRGGRISIEIRDAQSNKVLYSRGADRLSIPASNMKIITAAVALSKLHPWYRFRTEVWADGPIRNGVLHGNIYLKGYGDPSLVDEYLWTLARDVAYRGIYEIRGKVIADDSYFDDKLYGEGWGKIGSEAYFAPISALSLNFNTFVVTANPASKVGAPPKLFYMPPDKHLKLVNRAMTVSRKKRGLLKVVNSNTGVNCYEVVGSIPMGSKTREIRRTVGDPALYTVGSFEAYLVSWGVIISGEIAKGKVPQGAKLLLTRESEPLSRIVWAMGKMSNNFVAEQILKTLCAQKGPKEKSAPANTACGIKVVKDFLDRIGIEPGSYAMVDGSGLSRQNRLSARQVSKVLVAMSHDLQVGPEFTASLSIAGVDGTLEERFLKSSLKGMVRAKTGHLTGVNALSGYMPSRRGRLLAFSMIFNAFPGYHSTVERIEQRILEAVARY